MDNAIISDTSCLIALSKIDKLHLLKEIYNEIIITIEVLEEFGEKLPEWILVSDAKNKTKQEELQKILDKGEASSITLALELENSTLIIDEFKGRKIAHSYDLKIIGTVGVILIAGQMGLIPDVIATLLKLANKGFRLSDQLIQTLIDNYGEE